MNPRTAAAESTLAVDLPADPNPPRDRRAVIVPVFLPHAGCPHRCVFCDQQSITGRSRAAAPPDVRRVVAQWLGRSRRGTPGALLAFYGGSFLGQSPAVVRRLLDTAAGLVRAGRIDGVRFSTRPDTVDDRRLSDLTAFPLVEVELGAQSMDDRVLAASRRGHTAADTAAAVARLRAFGYRVGIQMMIGLPGDDESGALATARRIARLAPDFVRIYPCLVLAGSPLASRWRRGGYHPLDLDAAVTLARRIWRLFARQRIPVIRMGLQDTAALGPGGNVLAGPHHPAFGHLVHSAVCREALAGALERAAAAGAAVRVAAHPRRVSRVRGPANANLAALERKFRLAGLAVTSDPGLPVERMRLHIAPAALDPAGKGAATCVGCG